MIGNQRREVEQQLAAWQLPPEAVALIHELLRRTRLRQGERLELARELASHFYEGLAQGRTVGELIDTFGEPAACAPALRSGVMGKRAALDRATHRALAFGVPSLVVLAIVYTGAALWLAAQRPHIALDIDAALTRLSPVEHVAVVDSEVFKELASDPEAARLILLAKDWPDSDPALPPIGAWRDRHAAALGVMRESAISGTLASASCALATKSLALDAWLAAAEGDGARLVRDANAIAALGDRAERSRSLNEWSQRNWSQLEALRVLKRGLSRAIAVLAPEHLEALRGTTLLIGDDSETFARALLGERLILDDYLQRNFTDNGSGDGWAVVPEGDLASSALGPLVALVCPSRRQAAAAVDRMFLDISAIVLEHRPERAAGTAAALGLREQSGWGTDPLALHQRSLASLAVRLHRSRLELEQLRTATLEQIDRELALRGTAARK